ncbi:MAG: Rho termination factor N-terminal domain-containing protein [Deltaproteobacteria bacterium]|nr:MAG: Rho termination factor N-terminal domain-containing protein [Deltaproteobacteria bacterium]
MTVKELQRLAKRYGIKPGGLKKTELIKAIQRAEGNFDCFGTANGYCDQLNCLFRKDCLQ